MKILKGRKLHFSQQLMLVLTTLIAQCTFYCSIKRESILLEFRYVFGTILTIKILFFVWSFNQLVYKMWTLLWGRNRIVTCHLHKCQCSKEWWHKVLMWYLKTYRFSSTWFALVYERERLTNDFLFQTSSGCDDRYYISTFRFITQFNGIMNHVLNLDYYI